MIWGYPWVSLFMETPIWDSDLDGGAAGVLRAFDSSVETGETLPEASAALEPW